MADIFKLDGFDDYAKDLEVTCTAGDLRLTVDWDDVYHYEAATLLERALRILNDHWNDPEYKDMTPEPQQANRDDDDAVDAEWEERNKKAQAIMERLGSP
jgi:predicted NAD/FAD-binding protein